MRGNTDKTLLFCLCLSAGLGWWLHGLFQQWPSIITEFFAPVNESLWEHVKIIFWPYLLTGLYLTGTGRWRRAPWLATLLLTSALLPILGWQIHLHLGEQAGSAYLALYLLVVVIQFALPSHLPVPEGWEGVLSGAVILLCGVIVCWTILPPNHPLFHDLSLADTFCNLPC